jgi:hypothetical protein
MTRLRHTEHQAIISDGLNAVAFSYTSDGDVRLERKASMLVSGDPDLAIVSGEKTITELGEWLYTLPPKGSEIDGRGATLETKTKKGSRFAAVSVLSPLDAEQTELDERVFSEGLLPVHGRSALMAQHRVGELALFFVDRYYPIPVSTINQLGEWILEGQDSLVK